MWEQNWPSWTEVVSTAITAALFLGSLYALWARRRFGALERVLAVYRDMPDGHERDEWGKLVDAESAALRARLRRRADYRPAVRAGAGILAALAVILWQSATYLAYASNSFGLGVSAVAVVLWAVIFALEVASVRARRGGKE